MEFTEDTYSLLCDRVEILFLRVQLVRQRLQNAEPGEVNPQDVLELLGDSDGVADALNGCFSPRVFPAEVRP